MRIHAEISSGGDAAPPERFPHLASLVVRARAQAASGPKRIGLVYPCDAMALEAAAAIEHAGLGRVVLIGPHATIRRLAEKRALDLSGMELVSTGDAPAAAACAAAALARDGALDVLMKGSLHTDELMAAVVRKDAGLRTDRRISHVFVFDLPRYHKPLALADCVVNISPDARVKADILTNAIDLLKRIGVRHPKVGVVAAVETVNPAIPATVDAETLVARHNAGEWSGATIEGPFGFDNVISSEAARMKKLDSRVSGDADLLLMPDLNAGNMLYKSFSYIGGGDCAGLVLGAKVPIVLTSRADSLAARTASAALSVLATSSPQI
jgi:phosphate acetyltransferase